ncbi:hypothetical protein [Cyclobacterium qasimii]|uniref:Uncharacterized protein n=1 Tax=Cyclobacterium qasimii M12-11B TaxID=641524 RepID=S7VBF4_9BACT|nr:hypothetical protein [Cyclobacterium qasimii]EPR66897.1 hypothetical protein ADICYQ_4158 [Cyclobacterium qasimii M12-11B]
MRSFLLLLAVFSSFSLNAQQILPENWDPVAQGNKVLERLVKVTAPEVKGAHDAEFVLVDDYAYIVAEVNDLQPGESGNWDFIYSAMSIVNLKTLETEKIIPFARSEQSFENVTLPKGQCWIPRIIQKDKKTLRIYFVSELSGENAHSQVWYIDYNLRSGSFSKKIYKVKLKQPPVNWILPLKTFIGMPKPMALIKSRLDTVPIFLIPSKNLTGKPILP